MVEFLKKEIETNANPTKGSGILPMAGHALRYGITYAVSGISKAKGSTEIFIEYFLPTHITGSFGACWGAIQPTPMLRQRLDFDNVIESYNVRRIN